MGIAELVLIAVGLSMDAFAVSICKGLTMRKTMFKHCAVCGLWFGGFQTLMTLAGYMLGSRFEVYVKAFAPWIAFGLLALIGGNMIREALSQENGRTSGALDVKTMLLMAIATSIDALAVGITFVCVPVRVISASTPANAFVGAVVIGVITFALACIGVKAGNICGNQCRRRAELAGGVILLLIGVKILLERF